MAYQIKYAYTSHMGRVRANNEDNFWCCGEWLPARNHGLGEVRSGEIPSGESPAFLVLDGMGGESCGEIAAFLAAEKFDGIYKKGIQAPQDQGAFLQTACREMNRAVCTFEEENRIRSMGTTMAMIWLDKETIYSCNLGDSRIYRYASGQFQQISTDHVLGKQLFGKAPLTQFLGIREESMALEPEIREFSYQNADRYLICSDGVTDMLSDGEIADLLSRELPVEETVQLILERALAKGGRDNITMVLCEIGRKEEGRLSAKWVERLRSWLRKGSVQVNA